MQNVHPLFVHFPIALLSVGLLFDILGRLFNKESLRSSGWWCGIFGMVAILGAVASGLFAEGTVAHSDESHSIMETHKTLGLVAFGMFALLFTWRSIAKTRLPEKLLPLGVYFLMAAFGVGMMFYGAHLGGRLVYEFGVGGTAVQQPRKDVPHIHNHDQNEETGEQQEDAGRAHLGKGAIAPPEEAGAHEHTNHETHGHLNDHNH